MQINEQSKLIHNYPPNRRAQPSQGSVGCSDWLAHPRLFHELS